MDKNNVIDRLMALDTFTRNQIINEFENTLFVKTTLNTNSIEHFNEKKPFDFNEFYGGFVLVLGIIGTLGYFLK